MLHPAAARVSAHRGQGRDCRLGLRGCHPGRTRGPRSNRDPFGRARDQGWPVHPAGGSLDRLDGRNRVLKNRSLRRGLSYAIDRKTILEETVLRHPVRRREHRGRWSVSQRVATPTHRASSRSPQHGPGHHADRRGVQGAGQLADRAEARVSRPPRGRRRPYP